MVPPFTKPPLCYRGLVCSQLVPVSISIESSPAWRVYCEVWCVVCGGGSGLAVFVLQEIGDWEKAGEGEEQIGTVVV